MQTPNEIRRDLPSDLSDAELEPLVGLAMSLQAERPRPEAGFQEDLRTKLLGSPKVRRPAIASPRSTRVLVASYVTSGLLLLAVAAIGVAGAGPFAAG